MIRIETIGKEIKRAGLVCSVCGTLASYVALPPLVSQGVRRCKNHLQPEWLHLEIKFSGAFVPPAPLNEARPGATAAVPSVPVKAGPGDLFSFAGER